MDALDSFIFSLGHWVIYLFAAVVGIPLVVSSCTFWVSIYRKVTAAKGASTNEASK